MIILGLNAYHADAAAALYTDGCLLVAAEEERFCRIKHRAGFPTEAVQFCLREAGIRLSQVDYIAVGRNQTAKLGQKVAFLLGHPGLGRLALQHVRQLHRLEQELSRLHPGLPLSALRSKIHRVEHHRAHLASAFYASPFEAAALLSIDGSGDFTTAMTGVGQNLDIHVHASVDFPHSAGLFYTAFTQLLGFPHYGDEYKLMGLAAFGRPIYTDALMRILQLKRNGLFSLDLSWFRITGGNILVSDPAGVPIVAPLYAEKMIRRFGPPRLPGEPLADVHYDLAASVQHALEKVYFHVLNGLHRQTRLPTVCVAGGVSQNSVANGKITQQTSFNQLYIPPAGHDAGIALGAALYLQHQVLKLPRKGPLFTAFTGARFGSDSIEALLAARGLSYQKMEDAELLSFLAEKIAGGAVCGWFTGRAEFGPRALGGRSILADPRRADAKDLLNRKIKRREDFRPFAPAVLETHAAEYFDLTDPSPFMEKVVRVRLEKRRLLPAVTHLDGSARIQTVCPKTAPRFHALISAFHAQTGIPMLLNTSFNENEPIVNTPEEALHCFQRTQMDLLVLENHLLTR
jgi:carbamoyltransferase